MPFAVHTAPRLEPLMEPLMERFVAHLGQGLGPLEEEVIVIAQNTGLREWVEAELARRTGCAAGLRLLHSHPLVPPR